MSINRVQAGVPTGGRFAATQHAEADIAIVADDTLASEEPVAPQCWDNTPAQDGSVKATGTRNGHSLLIEQCPGDVYRATMFRSGKSGPMVSYGDTMAEAKDSIAAISDGIAAAERRADRGRMANPVAVFGGDDLAEPPF